MSSPKTVETVTPHGTVEYDVVECVNCGEEVVPKAAIPVGIGTETYVCDGLPFCRSEHERPRELRVLCEYCAESVLGYTREPDGVVDRLADLSADTSAVGVGLWLGIVAGIALAVTVLLVTALGVL